MRKVDYYGDPRDEVIEVTQLEIEDFEKQNREQIKKIIHDDYYRVRKYQKDMLNVCSNGRYDKVDLVLKGHMANALDVSWYLLTKHVDDEKFDFWCDFILQFMYKYKMLVFRNYFYAGDKECFKYGFEKSKTAKKFLKIAKHEIAHDIRQEIKNEKWQSKQKKMEKRKQERQQKIDNRLNDKAKKNRAKEFDNLNFFEK